MKTPRLIFAITLTTCFAASAQSDNEKQFILPKAVFKISPQHFFNSTFQFGTELFNGTWSRSANIDVGIRSGSQSYNDVKGFSTEIGYRKYVKPMTLRTRKSSRQFYQGVYYNFFVSGSYFSGYQDGYRYDSSGAPVYNNPKVTFKSYGAGFYMGLQKTLWEVVFMDVYVGGGIKVTETNRSRQIGNFYYDDDNFSEPGFEGIYPKIGVKFGIGL